MRFDLNAVPQDFPVCTDWAILKCGLFHLIYNAVKHSLKNSEISVSAELDDQGSLVTQVTNSCEHIRQRKWEKIAQPMFAFQRIACDKRETESVGIGLSTAHALAKALQGSLSFSVDQISKKFVC